MEIVKARFPKAKEPRYVFETLIRMLPEMAIMFTQSGISIKALDPTKTALLDVEFYSSAFEDYVLETEEAKIGIINTTLKGIIERFRPTDVLELAIDVERNRLALCSRKKKKNVELYGYYRCFRIPTVNLDEEEIPELREEYRARATLSAAAFAELLKWIDDVSDEVQIEIGPNSVRFVGVGDTKKIEIDLDVDSEQVLSTVADEPVVSKYSTETLLSVAGNLKSVAKYVEINMQQNGLGKFVYDFGSGKFTAIVAPRVD